MKYESFGTEDMIGGYHNRIRELEIEHFTHTVYIRECQVIGDLKTQEEYETKNKFLEQRIDMLKEEIQKLQKVLAEEQKDDDTV